MWSIGTTRSGPYSEIFVGRASRLKRERKDRPPDRRLLMTLTNEPFQLVDAGVRERTPQTGNTVTVAYISICEVTLQAFDLVSVAPGLQHRLDAADNEDGQDPAERGVQ
jgi:hypothetical protein